MINLFLLLLLPVSDFLLRRFWSLTNQFNASLRTPTGPEAQLVAEKHSSQLSHHINLINYHLSPHLNYSLHYYWLTYYHYLSAPCVIAQHVLCANCLNSVVIATSVGFPGRTCSGSFRNLLLRLLNQSVWPMVITSFAALFFAFHVI